MENTLEDTFHLWAKYLLHPWCCRCHRFAYCWEGCEECLDGEMLTQLNRHHRTLLQEYVRIVKGSCSWCWDDTLWRWRSYEWRGSDWWRTPGGGRQVLLTSSWYAGSSWGAEASDAEAWYYYDLAVEALEAQQAMRHTGYASHWRTWPWHQ